MLEEKDRCPDCMCWHGISPLEHLEPGVLCGHDKTRACDLCGESVGSLSTGGPGICCDCEVDPERPQKVRLEKYQRELIYNPKTGNVVACCVICRRGFDTIPYIGCPYTPKWVCGCENTGILEDEMLCNRIYLTREEVYGRT